MTDFVQSEPQEGPLSEEKTEVSVLYHQQNLYFGVYCYDSEPGSVIVKDLRQDFNWNNNDVFILTIDTFNDDRNGFHFVRNPSRCEFPLKRYNLLTATVG